MGEAPPGFELKRADVVFGQVAVARHFVSPQQVRECSGELARRLKAEPSLTLADVLVKRGYLTKNQRDTIQSFADKQLGPEKIGRYELISKIGEGGMGTVYKAKDASNQRTVALKVLPPDMAQDKVFMGRFQREALAVTRLEHPNIVRGLDVGNADGAQYIAMEFVDGLDCDRILTRRGRIPEKEAVRIASQVARALEYAGAKRLVHRDIKPANILVMQDGTAKLTDLGLAKSTSATAAKLTQTGITMGTPHYISPEQAMGASDLDIRSDVYSLGATLYHLVTGRVPFEGSSPAVIVAKHLTEELPNPQDIVPELTDGLVLVLVKMMAKDRDDRYARPEELAKDLESLMSDKSPDVSGLAPGLSTIKAAEFRKAANRLKGGGKGGKRSPVMLLVGILLGLALAVGVVVLVLRQRPELVDKARQAASQFVNKMSQGASWSRLFNGTNLDGWVRTGNRAWKVSGGLIDSPSSGVGRIESAATMSDYLLHMELLVARDADVYLLLAKPKAAARGGYRIKLPAKGIDAWLSVDAKVSGTTVSVMVDDKAIEPSSGGAVSVGTIAIDVHRGALKIREIRTQPLVPSTPTDSAPTAK
jgi:serine/threonine-protein kinase